MIKQAVSIFNDVIGPVMIGPSSSHTAGPVRIGKLAGELIQGKVKTALTNFETSGSFAQTYQGQKSDHGLIGGLLGWLPDDQRLPQALSEAKQQELNFNFRVKSFLASHSNPVIFELTGDTA